MLLEDNQRNPAFTSQGSVKVPLYPTMRHIQGPILSTGAIMTLSAADR